VLQLVTHRVEPPEHIDLVLREPAVIPDSGEELGAGGSNLALGDVESAQARGRVQHLDEVVDEASVEAGDGRDIHDVLRFGGFERRLPER
jgi:hypothetical protein